MKITWLLKRIQAMGGREIVHRLYKSVAQRLESFSLACGWKPCLRGESFSSHSLFENGAVDPAIEWNQYFKLDKNAIDRLANGQIDLFSYKNILLGETIDWLREPVNGVQTPSSFGKAINYRDRQTVGDIKILWELGRQQYLVPVAVGYLVTKNSKYRYLLKNYIQSWIMSCPFGYTVHWCSSLEVALRIISWSIVHSLLIIGGEKEGLFGIINPSLLRDSIFQHAYFIRNHLSLYSSSNNHLIGEITGLWTACNVFDLGKSGKRWAKLAGEYLDREASLQVYEDGVNKEQAIYYHAWVLEYLLFSYLVGKRRGVAFSDEYISRLTRMSDYLVAAAPFSGVQPQIGDADDGFVSRFSLGDSEDLYSDLISTVQCLTSNNGYRPQSQKQYWYSMMYGMTFSDKPIDRPRSIPNLPKIFRQGGYAMLGGTGMHIVFDAGALGYTSLAAHGHADALSVCIAIDGEWWFVDPGTYAYHDDVEWRNYFRGTSAHNTVMVDGLNQSKIGGDFLWLKHANSEFLDFGSNEECQWVSGTHDGYESAGVRHSRRVEYRAGCRNITISDSFDGRGFHELSWHWHLNPLIDSEWNGEMQAWVLRHKNSEKKLLLMGGNDGEWEIIKGSVEPILGWYSDQLGKKVPSEVLKYRLGSQIPRSLSFSFSLTE